MKIKIDEIPAAGLPLQISEDGEKLANLAGGLDFAFKGPIDARLEITSQGGIVFVEGEVRATLRHTCSRCLKEFEQEVDSSFNAPYETISPDEREKQLKSDELDLNYIEGGAIDTDEVILGQIAIEAPMQPLCSEDCKGLCPNCGADLNNGPCSCPSKGATDPRLEKLKDFKS